MITATGKCMGVNQDTFTDKKTGDVRETKRIGVGFPKKGGFVGEVTVFKITLDKDAPQETIDRINKLIGKQVTVGASVNEYEMNGKKGTSFKFNGNIVEVVPAATESPAPLKVAGAK